MSPANSTSEFEITLIVPFFNERDNLRKLGEKLSEYLPHSSKKACVLFVDDGSTDAGEVIAADLCRGRRDFFFVRLERNTGLSGALKAGFDMCHSPLIGYIDADMQTDVRDFEKLYPFTDSYQLISGCRILRKDSAIKRASSRFANGYRRMFTKDGMKDTCCPLKVIHTDMARKLPMFSGMHRFLPALVILEGGRCLEVPVRHYPRTAGKSKYSVLNRLTGPLADCFVFLWMRSRHIGYRIKETNLK